MLKALIFLSQQSAPQSGGGTSTGFPPQHGAHLANAAHNGNWRDDFSKMPSLLMPVLFMGRGDPTL